jgi:hypothetical protein
MGRGREERSWKAARFTLFRLIIHRVCVVSNTVCCCVADRPGSAALYCTIWCSKIGRMVSICLKSCRPNCTSIARRAVSRPCPVLRVAQGRQLGQPVFAFLPDFLGQVRRHIQTGTCLHSSLSSLPALQSPPANLCGDSLPPLSDKGSLAFVNRCAEVLDILVPNLFDQILRSEIDVKMS